MQKGNKNALLILTAIVVIYLYIKNKNKNNIIEDNCIKKI